MKVFIVKSMEIISYIGFFSLIVVGAISGYASTELGAGSIHPVLGAVFGLIVGFISAVIIFGVLFLLIDIADNTRRTREIAERR